MTTPKPLPTQQRLHELFYCVNGKLIRKIKTANRTHVGDVCGSDNGSGYYQVRVNGIQYLVHRVVWKWYYGTDPECILDHIDRDRTNNNIWNLRESDATQNNRNNKRTMEKHGGQLQEMTIDGKRIRTEYGLQTNREYYQNMSEDDKNKHREYMRQYMREYRQRKRQG